MLSSTEIKDSGKVGERIIEIVSEVKDLIVPFPEVLAECVVALHSLVTISDKVLPLKSYFNVLREVIDHHLATTSEINTANRLTEDTFMVACAVLDLDVGKQGGVSYLKGAAVQDAKERKKNRAPVDLRNGVVLKNLSAGLARPDQERGTIERGQIESGFNHLVRLTNMRRNMLNAVEWIKEGEEKGIQRRKIDVMRKFDIKNIEYEKMMTMARREKLIDFKNKKLDEDNNYRLSPSNHERIMERAAEFGFKPERLLNNVVKDFFDIIDKRAGQKNAKDK